jgi:chromosome partitioning protein
LVEADPQCNLTGMTLAFSGLDDFSEFYKIHPNSNLYTSVQPAFTGAPTKLVAAEITPTKKKGLYLLAGHIDLGGFESELAIAHKLSGAVPLFQNLPGALGHLIRETAKTHKCEIVLIDMSPSIGALNQNLFIHSDYFIVPTSPDYFCLLAINSLAQTLPRWADNAAELRKLQTNWIYKIPADNPKFIGMISQKFRPRLGKPAEAFKNWIDQIVSRVDTNLLPQLIKSDMVIDRKRLKSVLKTPPHVELAQISDFNSLIARSQECSTAVFALTEAQLKAAGAVLEGFKESRDAFGKAFAKLAERVEALIA